MLSGMYSWHARFAFLALALALMALPLCFATGRGLRIRSDIVGKGAKGSQEAIFKAVLQNSILVAEVILAAD